ncbi:DNA-3-methyladenine glycosylase [Cognatishimia sp.]|uniref:DNA-3-methyladenine glycosylase family protein n=1 Tax=Cognatishimia sp. TaxID=2211648 RepID=UPI003513EDE8
MVGRIIETDACVIEGAEWLCANVPCFVPVLDATGPLPLRRKKDGFETLLNAIVGQQVSVAAADAIWRRLKDAKLTGPRKILAASDEDLRGAGLSSQKVRYARALAEARINFKGLRDVSDADVIAELTQVTGIGVWTAEIYAMFSLGRADVFAHGDLALQEAAKHMLNLEKRPTEREMRGLAEPWSPWRSVAARALWAYYRVVKQREGIR